MALGHEQGRIECGREIDDLWEHIDLAPDAHEQDCPFCLAARTSLTELAQVTADLRSDAVTVDAMVPSGSVKNAIMRVARAEVRRGQRLAVVADGLGSVRISEQTVSAVVRFACDGVAGVRARRCTVAVSPPSADDAPSRVDVSLRMTVESSLSIPAVTDTVRARIDAVLDAQIGLRPRRIDLVVEDVYDV